MIKKVKKVIIMLLCILLILGVFFNRVEAETFTTSLEEFISQHSDVGKISDDSIREKYLVNYGYNETIQSTVQQNVSSSISVANGYANLNDAIKALDTEFSTNTQDLDLEGNKGIYLYWGYMLGSKRIELKNNSKTQEENKGKTDDELVQEFDSLYNQYQKLGDNDKKDAIKVSNLYSQMETIKNQIQDETKKKQCENKLKNVKDTFDNADDSVGKTDIYYSIYQKPQKEDTTTSAQGLDDMISDADKFVQQGKDTYNSDALQNFSSTMYNILASVAAAVALIAGIIIGIKYMMGSIEEKATYKQMLVPYLVGCIVVFGAFGIWKLLVDILSGI